MKRDFYNEAQAGEYVGVSADTIKRGIRSGDLKTVRGLIVDGDPVRRNIIAHDDLVAWVTGTKAGA